MCEPAVPSAHTAHSAAPYTSSQTHQPVHKCRISILVMLGKVGSVFLKIFIKEICLYNL